MWADNERMLALTLKPVAEEEERENREGGRYMAGNGTFEEDVAGFWMGRDTLKKGKGIAYSIRCCRAQLRRIQKWIDTNNLLQQSRHDPCQPKLHQQQSNKPENRKQRKGNGFKRGNGLLVLPKECHRMRARSSYCSRFLLNSLSAFSLLSGPLRS